MSKDCTTPEGFPPIPESVDGSHEEVFLTYRDLERRDRKCRRALVRWKEAGILPKPVLIGTTSKGFPLSKILEKEKSWEQAA